MPAKYEKFGVEKSTEATRVAREKGIAIISDDIHEITRLDHKFDVIVAMDVIEHLSNPCRFVRDILDLLSKEGTALLTTGDSESPLWKQEGAEFWYCALPEHISFICESWLKREAAAGGFRILHSQHFKYEQAPLFNVALMRSLAYLYRLLGLRPSPMWVAHKTEDHLFVALENLDRT
jgi:cyclopropane fatty-acyl-phospholipid synthase-like methyltransferase